MGVTSGIQTASQDFPLLSFLLGHPDMTYLLLLIITIVFSYFPGISRGPCNNWHYLGYVKHDDNDGDGVGDDGDGDGDGDDVMMIQFVTRTKSMQNIESEARAESLGGLNNH